MQRVPNLGSLLQSYSLKTMLEEQGCEVRFIDIEPNEQEDEAVQKDRHNFSAEFHSEGNANKRKLDRFLWNRIKNKLLLCRQDREFEKFRTNILNIKETDNEQTYDLCVIGSDEVFNCMTQASWGFTSQLFGNVRQSDRVITYAASCGATSFSDIGTEAAEIIRNAFQRIEGFSVRDKNTAEFVSKLTEQPVKFHLDPVWVADFTQEIEKAKLPSGLPSRYCVVYAYRNRFHREEDIQKIKDFCAAHQMEPIAIGAPQMWIRNFCVASPFEALKVIQNAQFVLTDTFHGTIFSEKYCERYAIVVRPSNSNKLLDLIERIGLQEHVVSNMDQLEQAYAAEKNKEESLKNQRLAREESIRFLSSHIQLDGLSTQKIGE